jgi:hypothetical protein
VPFTGFSPTLGGDAIVPVTSGSVQFNGMSQNDDGLSKILFDRGNRPIRRLLLTLLGSVVGSNATETYPRVQANQLMNQPLQGGGLVTIETATQINRNTTAADLSNVVNALSRSPITTFPTELSGTSGGGKLGY